MRQHVQPHIMVRASVQRTVGMRLYETMCVTPDACKRPGTGDCVSGRGGVPATACAEETCGVVHHSG